MFTQKLSYDANKLCEQIIIKLKAVIDLYSSDGSHPNLKGICLSALVFVRYFTKLPVNNLPESGSLTFSEYQYFQQVANEIVD